MATLTNTNGSDTPVRAIFLSQLMLETGRRDVWRLLGDTYALHQRILSAFPEASEGGAGRVLYRVDSRKGDVCVLVQSTVEPNWSRLHEASALLADAPRGPKKWKVRRDDETPAFGVGQRLRFRLRANPTFRCGNNNPNHKLAQGKRYALLERTDQADWLARKAEAHGFLLPEVPSGPDWLDPFEGLDDTERRETRWDVRITPLERLIGRKPLEGGEHRLTHYGVDFDGTLTLTNPEAFVSALVGGVGAGKGFGFGLLSVAPL